MNKSNKICTISAGEVITLEVFNKDKFLFRAIALLLSPIKIKNNEYKKPIHLAYCIDLDTEKYIEPKRYYNTYSKVAVVKTKKLKKQYFETIMKLNKSDNN